jgi:hypothetical protein
MMFSAVDGQLEALVSNLNALLICYDDVVAMIHSGATH